MYDVIILYESVVRELNSVVLLAAELINRGFSVKIINTFSYQISKADQLNTSVVIVPFLYSDSDIYEYVYKICGEVDLVINLRWEQLYSVDDENNLNSFGYPKGEAKKAYHVCWSQYLSDLLINAGVKKDKILLVGAINMDYFREPLVQSFLSKKEIAEKYGLEAQIHWNLFISSFSYTTLSEEEIKNYEKHIFSNARKLYEDSVLSKKKILEWIEKKMIEDNKEEIWIYRPHPAERSDEQIEQLSKVYPNFVVIREEPIQQWIMVADFIYNWRSTSMADCCFAGKKSFVLRPIKVETNRDSVLMQGMTYIETYEEFKDAKHNKICSYKNVKKYYGYYERASYVLMVDFIEKALTNNLKTRINYKQIIVNRTLKQKLKNSFIYYLYFRIIAKLSGRKDKYKIKVINNKVQIFRNNVGNILCDEEIQKRVDKVRDLLTETNLYC